MTFFRKLFVVSAVMLPLVFVAPTADAQLRFGAQASYDNEFDFGIGARAQVGPLLPNSGNEVLRRIVGIATFDYFFPDCGTDVECGYWDLSGNLALPFPGAALGATQTIIPYAGAGLSYANVSVDIDIEGVVEFSDSGNGIAPNLFGGLQFPLGGLSSYVEARYRASELGQFILTFGVLFGG